MPKQDLINIQVWNTIYRWKIQNKKEKQAERKTKWSDTCNEPILSIYNKETQAESKQYQATQLTMTEFL